MQTPVFSVRPDSTSLKSLTKQHASHAATEQQPSDWALLLPLNAVRDEIYLVLISITVPRGVTFTIQLRNYSNKFQSNTRLYCIPVCIIHGSLNFSSSEFRVHVKRKSTQLVNILYKKNNINKKISSRMRTACLPAIFRRP